MCLCADINLTEIIITIKKIKTVIKETPMTT